MSAKLYILILFICCGLLGCIGEQEPVTPNIILIAVDDMGYSDLGCYGSEIHTPHIDALAARGMRFTNFYNTSKCFPSRAALITGVYAQDSGYHQTYTGTLRNAVTIGEVLRGQGYRTYWAGKHHGKENPYDRGFDHYYGIKDGAFNHFNPGAFRSGEPKPAQKKKDREWGIDSVILKPYSPKEKDFYSTDYFTNYALGYLEEANTLNQPFFLYLAYTAPHDPLMAWPEDIEKYKGKYDKGYEPVRQMRYNKQLSMGLLDSTYKLSRPSHKGWDSLSEERKSHEVKVMEVYAAMIDRIDQNVGRVLNRLESLEFAENTIIFFVSDNGASKEVIHLEDDDDNAPIGTMGRWVSLGENWANVSNTPFRFYKNYNYEGGINTPMIAYWPDKIQPNSKSNYPGHFIDFMPTIVEITGAKYPASFNGKKITAMRGESLLPVFKNQKKTRENPLYWEWQDGQALRFNDLKIVRNDKYTQPWDLYDLKADPTETQNLNRRNPEAVRRLDSIFQVWNSKYYE